MNFHAYKTNIMFAWIVLLNSKKKNVIKKGKGPNDNGYYIDLYIQVWYDAKLLSLSVSCYACETFRYFLESYSPYILFEVQLDLFWSVKKTS